MSRHAGENQQKYAPGSLLTVEHLTVQEVGAILSAAARLDAMPSTERKRVLDGRTVALLFYESSTRTRTSFELAAKSLGATTTLVSDKSSSIEKGESLKDTGLTLRALGAQCIILRHNASGAASLLARTSGLPVLNAGDGMHQHPSQALLDVRAILTRLGMTEALQGDLHAKTLDGITIVIAGDILHSRVARSNAMLLPKLGAKVILCGPEALLPDDAAGLHTGQGPAIHLERDFDTALRHAEIVMMLRIQKERLLANTGIDVGEYTGRYQLNAARARNLSLKIVMHPGPMNRGLEIDDVMADGALSVIEEQVAHGLAVRRALLVRALGVHA